MALPSTWSRFQFRGGDKLPAYFCFRPPVETPWQLPAALVSPVFARFLDRCRSPLASLGEDEYEAASKCAHQLVAEMAGYYKLEAGRQTAVLKILAEFLGHTVAAFTFTGADDASSARVGAHSPLAHCLPQHVGICLNRIRSCWSERSVAAASHSLYATSNQQLRLLRLNVGACSVPAMQTGVWR